MFTYMDSLVQTVRGGLQLAASEPQHSRWDKVVGNSSDKYKAENAELEINDFATQIHADHICACSVANAMANTILGTFAATLENPSAHEAVYDELVADLTDRFKEIINSGLNMAAVSAPANFALGVILQ